MKKNLIIILIMFCVSLVFSQQENPLQAFEIDRQNINQTAMFVLGSWAIGNILTGTYGNIKAKGDVKYFHQFNAMWNVVNLGIATFGYLNAVNSNVSEMTSMDILNEYSSLQKFLLLNAGLDVAYIMTGLYLKEKSKASTSSNRLNGYGNSLILQGAFLLVFDFALFFIHQNNASIQLYPQLENLLIGEVSLGVKLKL